MTEHPQAEAVAAELLVGVGLLVRRLRRRRVDGDLSIPETSALARIDREGPITSSGLAKLDQISPQSMGVTVASLEARGLVARQADPDDGRRSLLTLTEAGAVVLGDRRSARTLLFAEVIAAELTDAEIDQLRAAAPLIERLAHRV